MRKIYYILLCALILSSCGISRTDLFHIASSDLQVYSYDPVNSSLPVPVNAKITVSFTAVMDRHSVEDAFSLKFNGTTYTADEGWFEWFAWDSAFVFHFDPDHFGGDFYYPPGTEITVRISSSARDEDGYYLVGGHEWTFTTSTNPTPDLTPPDVNSWNPVYSEQISFNPAYAEITFSEPMIKSSASHGFVLATSGSSDVRGINDGLFVWYDNNTRMRYYPYKPLQIGRDYWVDYDLLGIIPKDLAGNELNSADHIHSYPSAWANSIRLVVNHAQVPEDVTDFPVYVDLNALTVAGADPSFFSNCDPAGNDIMVIDEKRTTKLPRELVYIEPGFQKGELWFRAQKLSRTEDTVFYILYNSPILTETNDPAVWSNGYLGVYHLHGDFEDSSPNNNRGVPFGPTPEPAGKIGEAQSFDGMGNYFELPFPDIIKDTGTVSMWIKPWDWTYDGPFFDASLAPKEFFLDINSLTLRFKITDANDNMYEANKNVSLYPNNTWHHVAGVWKYKPAGGSAPPGPVARLFFDGFIEDERSGLQAERPPLQPPFIGIPRDIVGPTGYFWGKIDEVHISEKVRSFAWINTEYNNQEAPWLGGFFNEIVLEP